MPILVEETVRSVQEIEAIPFIIPAMGSHGGASSQGQADVLKALGVTEDRVGAPIISSMKVVKVGSTNSGIPIYTDQYAYEADHIIVINRIKPHTAFRGEVESGLTKMITIGLGKQKGAEEAHKLGFGYMADHVPEMAHIVREKSPILFGLGTIENAYDQIAKVVAIPAECLEAEEPVLLKEAKQLMPKILINPIDVLIIDEIGKDISGDGMDPNISGRFATPYADGGVNATRVVVLDLTSKTTGNANGIGLADLTTRQAFEKIQFEKGYVNALTSTVLEVVKLPMFLESKELAVKAAIKTSQVKNLNEAKIVRIKNTLELERIQVSTSLLDVIHCHASLTALSKPKKMNFQ